MTENNQTQFKTEGEPAFPIENKENDNSSESSTEKTNSEQTQSDEGEQNSNEKKDGAKDAGFADEPRWKERENDWKKRFNEQETRHTSEIEKLRGEIKNSSNNAELPKEIPEWFGGDAKQWKSYTDWHNSSLKQVEEQALNRITTKQADDQKKVEDATNYFNETIKSIESDENLNPQGVKIDKNKLLKFVLDNDLVDSQGRWNYKAGFMAMRGQIVQAKNSETTERKKLANVKDDRAESKQPFFATSSDFSKPGAKPW